MRRALPNDRIPGTNDVNETTALELRLNRADQVMAREPNLFTGSRLIGEVGEWIETQWKHQPKSHPNRLIVYLPDSECSKSMGLGDEISRYFQAKRRSMEMQRTETLRRGWASAKIGLAFLFIVLVAAELVNYIEGRVPEIISEGLSIFGWVALWRPTEELLYDWYPLAQDIARYRTLEALRVELRDVATSH